MDGERRPGVAFTVATLVNDPGQYRDMRDSFVRGGFGADEFLHIDNTRGNRADAVAGLAGLLEAASGRWVVVCHQDVRLLAAGWAELRAALLDLEQQAPAWMVAGNAGIDADGVRRARISDPYAEDERRGPFPAPVVSLDENFLVVRAESRLRPSPALGGYHFYGTDLCLRARGRGGSAHVIDFHLRHLGRGRMEAGFYAAARAFERVHAPTRPRGVVATTCTEVVVGLPVVFSFLGRWLRAAERARRETGYARRGARTRSLVARWLLRTLPDGREDFPAGPTFLR